MKLNNKYYIMRHGQAISNVKNLCSSWPEKINNPLTDAGKEMIRQSAEKLAGMTAQPGKNIDLIFASPLLRTQQTAEIVADKLNLKVITDERLKEIDFGIFSGGPLESMWKHFKNEEERIRKRSPGGENYSEILKRMMSFLKEINKKHKGKNILIVSHDGPLTLLQGKMMGLSLKETIGKFPLDKRIHKGEIRELN